MNIPFIFLFHLLVDSQNRWKTIENETLAIVYALQNLDYYINNAKFIIFTDHKSLQYILKSPIQNTMIQLWALPIERYDCRVEYWSGRYNLCADQLWRIPNPPVDKNLKPLDIDYRPFDVSLINSNEFESQDFYWYCLEENQVSNEAQPLIPGGNNSSRQDADKDIKEP